MREATKARTLFDQFIEQNEIYAGQISSSLGHFRNDLMIPIIKMIQELEKKADELHQCPQRKSLRVLL